MSLQRDKISLGWLWTARSCTMRPSGSVFLHVSSCINRPAGDDHVTGRAARRPIPSVHGIGDATDRKASVTRKVPTPIGKKHGFRSTAWLCFSRVVEPMWTGPVGPRASRRFLSKSTARFVARCGKLPRSDVTVRNSGN